MKTRTLLLFQRHTVKGKGAAAAGQPFRATRSVEGGTASAVFVSAIVFSVLHLDPAREKHFRKASGILMNVT